MFTKRDVQDAYFANRCEVFAETDETTPEAVAAEGTIVYDESNKIDRAATAKTRQAEIERLNHGLEILKNALLIIGARQVTRVVTLVSDEAPTIFVPAGHIATNEAFRQATLVSDVGYLTPAEIAEKTGTAESSWRNKAAAGDLPGAIKKGKQWLLPRSILRT